MKDGVMVGWMALAIKNVKKFVVKIPQRNRSFQKCSRVNPSISLHFFVVIGDDCAAVIIVINCSILYIISSNDLLPLYPLTFICLDSKARLCLVYVKIKKYLILNLSILFCKFFNIVLNVNQKAGSVPPQMNVYFSVI